MLAITDQDTVISPHVINMDNATHRDQTTLKWPTNTNHQMDIQITSNIKETLAIQAIRQTNHSHKMPDIQIMEEPQLRVTQLRQDTLGIRLLKAIKHQQCKVDARHPVNKIVT